MGYRRVTARGVRPVQPYQVLYEYYWLYGAVEPKTGEAFYLEMPTLDGDCFSVFLAEFARSYADTLNVVVPWVVRRLTPGTRWWCRRTWCWCSCRPTARSLIR